MRMLHLTGRILRVFEKQQVRRGITDPPLIKAHTLLWKRSLRALRLPRLLPVPRCQ